MKKRVFSEMDDGVYRVAIMTEDWSEGDVRLMEQFGEPEVNVGGTVRYTPGGDGGGDRVKEFGDLLVRILHGFPHVRGFDSRDYGSVGEAVAVAVAWKEAVLGRIDDAVKGLRANSSPLPTEEVSEI